MLYSHFSILKILILLLHTIRYWMHKSTFYQFRFTQNFLKRFHILHHSLTFFFCFVSHNTPMESIEFVLVLTFVVNEGYAIVAHTFSSPNLLQNHLLSQKPLLHSLKHGSPHRRNVSHIEKPLLN